MIPVWIKETLPRFGTIVPAVRSMIEKGYWHYDEHQQNKEITKRYFGTLQAFLPRHVRRIIEEAGFTVLRCSGLGTLANLCGDVVTNYLKENDAVIEDFLDLCEYFDRDVMPNGPGTKQRAGLIAVGERS
jgi:hypothetical protein